MYYRLKQLLLIAGDLAFLYTGFYLGVFLRYREYAPRDLFSLISPISELFVVAVLILFIIGLYDIGRVRNSLALFQKILITSGIWVSLAVLFFYISPTTLLAPKTTLLFITIGSFSLLTLWRTMYNHFLSTAIWKTGVVFAGASKEVSELAEIIKREPERGFVIMGIVAPPNSPIPAALQTYPKAETLSELVQKNKGQNPELIILNPSLRAHPIILNELYQTLFRQVVVLDLAEFYETVLQRIPPFTFSEAWFITNLKEQRRKIYDRFRILVDYTLAITMAVPFFISLPFVAILIKTTSRGPVFFKQKRIGRLGRPFTIYKYRTMQTLASDGSAETNGPQFASVNDQRVTRFGKILRQTRIDELPQFINIIRGDMAIIGPRPERPEFVRQLTEAMPFYAVRHLIKPGLTGWAQLQQAYYGNIKENLYKLEYDLFYIKNRGVLLDITILLRTINIVARFMGR